VKRFFRIVTFIMFLLSLVLATAVTKQLPVTAGPPEPAQSLPDGGLFKIYLPALSKVDPLYIMPMDTALPWGAVGFMDNGCTATLIDPWHILAAAHCFTFDNTGDWQDPIYFFPNYHPDRSNPPYYKVVRAVVGSRVNTCCIFLRSDWGIGFLEAAVTGFPTMQISSVHPATWPDEVSYAGYARDAGWFPYAPLPAPSVTPPLPTGQRFCPLFSAPPFDMDDNCWWTPALVDDSCTVLADNQDALILETSSCRIIGGNSGSPIVWNLGSDTDPLYRLAGVVHGGDIAAATARYEFAPRYAYGAAIAAVDDGNPFSQVFVTDPDADFIARRWRDGQNVDDPFTLYSPLYELPDPFEITAFNQNNGRPQLVVISGYTELYTSYVDAGGNWVQNVAFDGPPGTTVYLDLDSAYDAQGNEQLYLIADDGRVYTRRKETTDPLEWRPWELLTELDFFTHVSAVRRPDGTQRIFLQTNNGELFTMEQLIADPDSGWSTEIPMYTVFNTLQDWDVSLTPDGRRQVFAIADDGSLWTRYSLGVPSNSNWSLWEPWDVPLFTPDVTTDHYIEGLQSLVADLWLEETGNDLVPVVLATDDRGNIYITTYTSATGWARWRSFFDN